VTHASPISRLWQQRRLWAPCKSSTDRTRVDCMIAHLCANPMISVALALYIHAAGRVS
jgi:hypothetical protein